jgi:hypothetical protein
LDLRIPGDATFDPDSGLGGGKCKPSKQPGVDCASGPGTSGKARKLLTKRIILTLLGMALGTAALWGGKLDGGSYVYLVLGCIAGHHAEDIVKAWRK